MRDNKNVSQHRNKSKIYIYFGIKETNAIIFIRDQKIVGYIYIFYIIM